MNSLLQNSIQTSCSLSDSSLTQFFPDPAQFEPAKTFKPLSRWASIKIGTLEARLENLQQRLNKSRHSLPPRSVVLLASRVFGYNGWSSRVCNCAVTNISGEAEKYTVSHTAEVEVILSDGTKSRANGYGKATNLPKARAYNKSIKEATTQATMRAILGLVVVMEEADKR
ncbi:hypothetical protein PGUG_04172 [Meyerozyma guilliermondii ATCC 6260]|uniref:DNA repair protein RAD59 n=1 Tax=Meyerozyma guilliermondii (strain ATCC 6260 / CBS 566 / DSM 6381 / JCM 1539 / NBRC 10279 / NRRL Y-324) TaxID=294746 RepID=A5DLM1_PICGU|nr:uncharacterized protein PGUG_04172 [Meyerozyma guilliermondii ATCC 6260]EDK40074.2 hypothetical protein PGUG_04172 [Meyerozyma guilliermondii ATCC 6260]